MSGNSNQHLPRPLKCDACRSFNVHLVNNEFIYGESKGSWPLCYLCSDCGAAVSCHPNTDHPMGYMADPSTRRLRGQTHKQFDKLWREGYMDRDTAYVNLAQHLSLTLDRCHISMFNGEQCKEAIAFSKRRLAEVRQISRGVIYRRGQRTKKKY